MKKTLLPLIALFAFLLVLGPRARAEESLCAAPALTAQGPVSGHIEDGTGLCAYQGIPYAAPPVGELRWRPPRPAPAHDQVYNADSFGPRCLQLGINPLIDSDDAQSEDCLYLNVLRPLKSGVFPVMVWIHGGGLLIGSGSDPRSWGDRMASRNDMVFVSINYRLGPFGFLAHPALGEGDPDGTAGNFGLLDQIAALKWVQENIAVFGGDPDNVTIFGISAGGWSVCNLLATPLAQDLFHRAIIQSGGCDVVKTTEEAYADGRTFANNAGCTGLEVASCLRDKSADEIMEIDERSRVPAKGLASMLNWMYTPLVDGRVLLQKPVEALRSGQFNQTPLIAGSTRDEAALWALLDDPFFLRLRPSFMADHLIAGLLGPAALPGVHRLYPHQDYRRPADAAIAALGDMALGCKVFEAAEAAAQFQPRTYYYRFDFDGHRFPHKAGAAHGSDSFLTFGKLDDKGLGFLTSAKQAQQAQPLSDLIMDYWYNFAVSGDPNGLGLLEWPAYNHDNRRRMLLDVPPSVQAADNVDKCEFWREQDLTIVGALQ